ncbi:hypothetical protein CI109_101346 [Kwoniella shandongensis]|uniref:Uncharacterized protein n=1 Tax=Kwoniella shandongensis TaxID=1734106 RepID=A0A5M6BZB3_9TREE|nr:uncharacterized protein CI109_005275 [Kwoniella shandongensis]KAA5526319.1 hypothetical protein CI109_005275 [Kwoniella shandongensis]
MADQTQPVSAPSLLDYRTYELKEEIVDDLVERIRTALVNLEDKTGEHKYTIAGGRVIDSISWGFWEWPQAIGLYGLFNYFNLKSTLGPESPQGARTLQVIKEWYTARAAEPPTLKNINTMSVLLTLASLMEVENERGGIFTKEEKELYSAWIDEWAEWVMNELPRTEQGIFQHITFRLANKNQVWDDTLMMTVLPLAKIGHLLGRPHYIEEAKYQFIQHSQYLMDQTTGLWAHGYEFDGGAGGHSWGNIAWARGNCWITIAIPIFLDLIKLPPTDPVHRTLTSVLHRQVDALLKLQDPDTGLWRTLLLDPSSYVETSASAGFVAGMFIGIRTGLLDRERYLSTALSGLKACIAQVQPSGIVQNVSKGTPVSTDPNFYKSMPLITTGFGQSLVIMALGEWLRLERA